MGIQEKLRQKPGVAIACSIAMLAICGFVIYRFTLGQFHPNMKMMSSAFYSDDDGKTWFVDDVGKIPPFDHNGKSTVRAAVYRYGDGKQFVGYLEKFSDDDKARIESAIAAHPEQKDHWLQGSMQVKKPGGSSWISSTKIEYVKAKAPISPDGSKNISVVTPSDPDAMPEKENGQ